MEGARFVPNTLRAIPGAYTFWNDAAFCTPPMVIADEAPIVNVTGTFTNCGMVFAD